MRKTPLRRKTKLKSQKASKKKLSLTKLKKKLWEECRRIIRARDGNVCYTCGKTELVGSDWHTGHFITSSVCSAEMRYDLGNLASQCSFCNIHRSGNWPAYEAHLIRDYGGDFPANLKRRNEETKGKQYDSLWYLSKIEEYKKL